VANDDLLELSSGEMRQQLLNRPATRTIDTALLRLALTMTWTITVYGRPDLEGLMRKSVLAQEWLKEMIPGELNLTRRVSATKISRTRAETPSVWVYSAVEDCAGRGRKFLICIDLSRGGDSGSSFNTSFVQRAFESGHEER